MQQIFQDTPSEKVRGFIVWLPMFPGDNQSAAAFRSLQFQDHRLLQGWDAERRTGFAFGQALGLRRAAWDVYLIYPPAVMWNQPTPPAPLFWMHQLGPQTGADPALRLDRSRLQQSLRKVLESSARQ